MEFYQDNESGWWCARGIGVDIYTQGKTLDELVANVKEAVELHFEDELASGELIKIITISELDIEVPVSA